MLLSQETTVIVMTLCIVIPIVLLAFVAFAIAIIKRRKAFFKRKEKTNGESKYALFLPLFGENNILSVECDMSRVTVEVKDIDIVNTALLQENGASGVLLVGNKVKCNFKEDSEEIANYLKGTINND